MNSRYPVWARSGATLYVMPGTDEGGDAADDAPRSTSFRRYPLWSVLLTNGLTFVHYVVGASAIVVANSCGGVPGRSSSAWSRRPF